MLKFVEFISQAWIVSVFLGVSSDKVVQSMHLLGNLELLFSWNHEVKYF